MQQALGWINHALSFCWHHWEVPHLKQEDLFQKRKVFSFFFFSSPLTGSCFLFSSCDEYSFLVLQNSTNSIRQTKTATAGEAGVCSGGC